MSKSLVKALPLKPPKELIPFLEDVSLLGDEKAAEYTNILCAIVVAAKPADAIDWLYVQSIANLTWDIKREQAIKAGIVALFQKETILDLLKTTCDEPNAVTTHTYRIFEAEREANQWATDSSVRKKINTTLSARGYSPPEVLARAYTKGVAEIDAVDRRIASYEARRIVALREIERRHEKLARDLEHASSEIIDAEFSEAAE
jgi:hypothetical protein